MFEAKSGDLELREHCCECAQSEDRESRVCTLANNATAVLDMNRPGTLYDAAEAFLLQEFQRATEWRMPKL